MTRSKKRRTPERTRDPLPDIILWKRGEKLDPTHEAIRERQARSEFRTLRVTIPRLTVENEDGSTEEYVGGAVELPIALALDIDRKALLHNAGGDKVEALARLAEAMLAEALNLGPMDVPSLDPAEVTKAIKARVYRGAIEALNLPSSRRARAPKTARQYQRQLEQTKAEGATRTDREANARAVVEVALRLRTPALQQKLRKLLAELEDGKTFAEALATAKLTEANVRQIRHRSG